MVVWHQTTTCTNDNIFASFTIRNKIQIPNKKEENPFENGVYKMVMCQIMQINHLSEDYFDIFHLIGQNEHVLEISVFLLICYSNYMYMNSVHQLHYSDITEESWHLKKKPETKLLLTVCVRANLVQQQIEYQISILLTICEGRPPITNEYPSKKGH